MNLVEANFSQICRICLKSNERLFCLFKTEAPSMLNFCGFLKIIEDDNYPDKICEKCNDMLIQSYKLKQLCLASQSYLGSLIEARIILDSPSKSDHKSANSNFDCERLQSPGEEISKREPRNKIALQSSLHTCSECQIVLSSKKLFDEHNCDILVAEDHLILASNECVTSNPLIHSENDPDSNYGSEIDEKNNITYHCSHCNIQFDHKQDVVVHESIHSEEEPICNVCNKLFHTMKTLKRHIKTHMITKSHICKICDKGFSESTALLKHTRRHHLGVPRDKKYTCDQCGQRFTDQYYLNLHTRKHTGEKPFECNICNKSFRDPRSFKVHMDVHKGTKPYLCSHCGKSFVQSAHLRQHLLVHTKEKPYSCNICNKRFTQSTSLQRHQKIHSDMFCYECSKSFLNKKQFLEHKNNHIDIKITKSKYIEEENCL